MSHCQCFTQSHECEIKQTECLNCAVWRDWLAAYSIGGAWHVDAVSELLTAESTSGRHMKRYMVSEEKWKYGFVVAEFAHS